MPTRYHRSTGTAYEVPARTTTRQRTGGVTGGGVRGTNNVNRTGREKAIQALGKDIYNSLPLEERIRMEGLAEHSTAQNVRIQANNWLRRNKGFHGQGSGGSWGTRGTRGIKSNGTDKNVRHDPYATSVTGSRIAFATSTATRQAPVKSTNNNTKNTTKQSQGQRSNSSAQSAPRNNPPAAISDTTAVRTQAPAAATPTVAQTRQTPVRAQASAPVQAVPAAPAKISNKVGNTPAKSNKPTTHTISQGETLSGIAKKYGVDWRQLAKDNGIEDPNMIIAGRKLNINGSTKTPKRNKPRRSMRTTPVNPRVLVNTATTPVIPSMNVGVSYPSVESGFRTPDEILGGF